MDYSYSLINVEFWRFGERYAQVMGNFAGEIFLLGSENLMRGDFDHSNLLKTAMKLCFQVNLPI